MLELLKEIPDWFGEALTQGIGWVFAGFFALVGGLIKFGWDAWKRHRLPFKPDKERFDWVMETVSGEDIQYFLFTENYNGIAAHRSRGIFDASEAISLDTKVKFFNKNLLKKENELRKHLYNLAVTLATEAAPHRSMAELYTIKMIDHDSSNPRHVQHYKESERKLLVATQAAMTAYENFRDFGARYFATKLA